MKRTLILAIALGAFLPAVAAERAPEATRKGRTVVAFKDDSVQVVLGYRWMNANPSATWVPLQFAVSSVSARSIEIVREDIALVTPSGERVGLPTQAAFMKGVQQPERILRAAAVASDPITGYFPGSSLQEELAFFVVLGEAPEPARTERSGTAYDRVTVDHLRFAEGYLWFPLPGGVAPGRYHLEIKSKWAQVDLPFDVPAPPLDKKKAKDAGVTW